MTSNQNSTHKAIVSLWEEKNIKNLRTDQAIQVFGNAIQMIERRCLITLSTVTVYVVLDRIIHQGIEKFPLLIEITIEDGSLNLTKIYQKKNHYELKEINNAFRYLLIELLTVIGNITSEVLSAPLHKELMEVTSESALQVLEVQSLKPNATKKRGEK
jgi:hypothetical protein